MRDTIARRSDVNKDSIEYEVEPGNKAYRLGTVRFSIKKGESFDLKSLVAELSKTRLAKGTKSGVTYLQITIGGEVNAGEKEMLLKLPGEGQQFVLTDDAKAKRKEGEKTPFERLRESVKGGGKTATVTGRVEGWSGVWPTVLSDLSKQMADAKYRTTLVVTDFAPAKP